MHLVTSASSYRIIEGHSPEGAPPPAPARVPAQRLAVVLSDGASASLTVLPVLAGLGIITIERPFDGESAGIIAAARPELVAIVCDLADPAASRMLSTVVGSGPARIVALDTGRSVTGSVAAFELGADTVLSLLDDARIIRAAIGALLRRVEPVTSAAPDASRCTRIGDLVIDLDTCEARASGEVVPLTRTEFRIVSYLASHAGSVRSPGQILSAIHDYTYTDAEAQQAVKVYIRRIRQKLDACATRSAEIVTTRAFGYRLQAVASRAGLTSPGAAA
jgi:DNA-binding response OmpR family regulator